MTPDELISAAEQIRDRWPDALIYPNPPAAPNRFQRHPALPWNATAVDVDRVWPHDCEDEDDCTRCYGWYRLVAWIDIMGVVHWVEPAVDRLIDASVEPDSRVLG